MNIKPTEEFLNSFDYNYKKKDHIITVEVNYGYHLLIDFSNPEKAEISDKLIGYNILTGFIPMKVKNGVFFNFLLIGVLSFALNTTNFQNGMITFFCLSFWPLSWGLYFLTKSEHLKKFMIAWGN